MIWSFALVTAMALSPTQNSGTPAGTPTSVAAVDPQRLAIGRELIDIVLPPEKREQMMASIVNSMMQNMLAGLEKGSGLDVELDQNPAKKAVLDRFIDRQRQMSIADINAALPDLVEAYAHAYARNFSLDELVQIKAFLGTPAGAKFMQRAPSLLSDPDVTAVMRNLTAKQGARQQAELKKLTEDLEAAGGKAKTDAN